MDSGWALAWSGEQCIRRTRTSYSDLRPDGTTYRHDAAGNLTRIDHGATGLPTTYVRAVSRAPSPFWRLVCWPWWSRCLGSPTGGALDHVQAGCPPSHARTSNEPVRVLAAYSVWLAIGDMPRSRELHTAAVTLSRFEEDSGV